MINLTILFLKIGFIPSVSPFYMICQTNFAHQTSQIVNSCFKYTFSNFIYSNTNRQQIHLLHDKFSFSLNSAIFLESSDIYRKHFYNETFQILHDSEELVILSCTFDECLSSFGGGIYAKGIFNITLHDNNFRKCRAKDGAGVHISRKSMLRDDITSTDLSNSLNSMYNCFTQCYVTNDRVEGVGFGGSMSVSCFNVTQTYTASSNNTLYDNETKARGAQFDVYAYDFISEYTNVTIGFSVYCGSIESRYTKNCLFRFNTIIRIDSMYGSAFTVKTPHFSQCNFINNTVRDNTDYVTSYPNIPSLIFSMNVGLSVYECAFCNNTFLDYGQLASGLMYEDIEVYLTQCQCDCDIVNSHLMIIGDCAFNLGESLELIPIESLFLYDCMGIPTGPPLPTTQYFTKSSAFAQSSKFTKSSIFTQSSKFTISNTLAQFSEFTKPSAFTQSTKFTKSSAFTQSTKFTKSIAFTQSSEFTKSSTFTPHTPTKSASNKVENSITVSMIASYTQIKSVSFSASYVVSKVMVECGNEMCESDVMIYTNALYIIPFLSETQVPTNMDTDTVLVKKTMSPEMMIGIVCGSAAAVFIIIGIVIFAYNRKYHPDFSSHDIISSSSDEIRETDQQTKNETTVTFDNNQIEVLKENDDLWI